MRLRKFVQEYGMLLVYPLSAIMTDLLCLRALQRLGDGRMIPIVGVKDCVVVGLALILIPLRWREITAEPEGCGVGDASGIGNFSLGGYASQRRWLARDLGWWGRLPRAVILSVFLSILFDSALLLLVLKP